MLEYFLVFLGAAIPWMEIALVIPLGIVAGLSPFWVIVLAFTGNMLTVIPLIAAFEKFQEWYKRRKQKRNRNNNTKMERGRKLWNKYGLPGLSILGPLVTGTHVAVLIGMSLGASKYWTTVWMTVSIGLWSLVFGIGTVVGMDWLIVQD
nr:small multi-drug export protein [Virgibacillus sp. YIM 98842]